MLCSGLVVWCLLPMDGWMEPAGYIPSIPKSVFCRFLSKQNGGCLTFACSFALGVELWSFRSLCVQMTEPLHITRIDSKFKAMGIPSVFPLVYLQSLLWGAVVVNLGWREGYSLWLVME